MPFGGCLRLACSSFLQQIHREKSTSKEADKSKVLTYVGTVLANHRISNVFWLSTLQVARKRANQITILKSISEIINPLFD